MDRDFLERNKPATDRPPDDLATPVDTWSPQPSRVYTELDNAAAGGARRPDVVAQADALMERMQDTTGGCAAQNHPFVIPEHQIQHTAGDVKTDLDFGIGLRSGQGQSGFGEPPVILPTRGPEGEVSIIELPTPARQRQGT
jgi:hypothetical protein